MPCVQEPLPRSPPLSPHPFSTLCVLESRLLSVHGLFHFPGELEKQQGTKTLSFKAGGAQGDPQSKQGSPTGEFQTWGPACVEAPPTPQPWGPGDSGEEGAALHGPTSWGLSSGSGWKVREKCVY